MRFGPSSDLRSPAAITATALGVLIGPVVLLLLIDQQHVPYSAVLLLPLAVLQIRGIVRTVQSWRGPASTVQIDADGRAARSSEAPQRGSVVLAGLGVLFVLMTFGGYIALDAWFISGFAIVAALILIAGVVGLGGVIVPSLLLQAAWRQPHIVETEREVLAGEAPGAARSIRRGRAVALVGWLVVLGAVLFFLLTDVIDSVERLAGSSVRTNGTSSASLPIQVDHDASS